MVLTMHCAGDNATNLGLGVKGWWLRRLLKYIFKLMNLVDNYSQKPTIYYLSYGHFALFAVKETQVERHYFE